MELIFKQRFFSWLDSYDVYDETGKTVFTVEGKLSWGHCLQILDAEGNHVGTVKEEILTFLPRFRMFLGESYIGQIQKEFTLFRPSFHLDCNGWQVTGDWLEWEYEITAETGGKIAQISKQLLNWTDTYVIDIAEGVNPLLPLMVVLAIDAAKCSSGQ